jgi:HAD superfamily hydrolase (TIGR01509 family)
MVKAILFDLDGVLVDACEWHYLALNEALKAFHYPEISKKEHEKKFNGLPTRVKLNILKINEEDFEKINTLKQNLTEQIIDKNATIMPEKIKLHNFLKNKEIKIGCVTNSIRKTAEHMLKKTGQYEFMDIIISNEDVIKNKPDPDCYNLAIKKLNILSSEILCVEDSEKGILAALNSMAEHLLIVNNAKEVNVTTIQKKLQEIS